MKILPLASLIIRGWDFSISEIVDDDDESTIAYTLFGSAVSREDFLAAVTLARLEVAAVSADIDVDDE